MSQTSTALISTPQKAVSALPSSLSKQPRPTPESVPPSPGTFRHPRLTEIIARQSASSFTSRNASRAAVSVAVLVLTFVLSDPLYAISSTFASSISIPTTILDSSQPIWLFRIYLVINLLLALRPAIPLLARPDDIADIPLTPTQRALLGLNPSTPSTPLSAPPGSITGFVTPPRYRRSSGTNTPYSQQAQSTDRRSISANYSGSPLSTSRHTLGFSPSPHQSRRASGSPFSSGTSFNNTNGSPLLHRAVISSQQSNTFSDSTSSFGNSISTSTLGRSQSLKETGNRRKSAPLDLLGSVTSGPGTPSPSSRKAMPGLNYKWLYERSANSAPGIGSG